MPPKTAAKGGKKDVKKPAKPMKSKEGGGKAKKKKWSKGKVRDKLNNLVLFDQQTYDKFMSEVPQMKLITPSVVSERLKIRASLARHALEELHRRGMRVNQDLAILTSRLALVPYCSIHVAKYHRWMQSEYLRHMTCSEELTLDEELEGQKNWSNADDRITCILLDLDRLSQSLANSLAQREEDAMIGDINMFFSPFDQPDHHSGDASGTIASTTVVGNQDSSSQRTNHPPSFQGELSVMIADETCRGRGLASEAIAAFATLIESHVPFKVDKLVAKVDMDNEPSIRLFRDRLGFLQESVSECFNQITLVRVGTMLGDSCLHSLSELIGTKLKSVDCKWQYREDNLHTWRQSFE